MRHRYKYEMDYAAQDSNGGSLWVAIRDGRVFIPYKDGSEPTLPKGD